MKTVQSTLVFTFQSPFDAVLRFARDPFHGARERFTCNNLYLEHDHKYKCQLFESRTFQIRILFSTLTVTGQICV